MFAHTPIMASEIMLLYSSTFVNLRNHLIADIEHSFHCSVLLTCRHGALKYTHSNEL